MKEVVDDVEIGRLEAGLDWARHTGLAEQLDGVETQRAQRIGHDAHAIDSSTPLGGAGVARWSQPSWSKNPLVGSSSSSSISVAICSRTAPIDSRWRPAPTVFCSLSSRISNEPSR